MKALLLIKSRLITLLLFEYFLERNFIDRYFLKEKSFQLVFKILNDYSNSKSET